MSYKAYAFVRLGNTYEFMSVGKREVQKVVGFSFVEQQNAYNLYFGDASPKGRINDRVNTNNGDIIRVFATIIQIITDFFQLNPKATVFFKGSNEVRTNLYGRILRRYYISYKHRYEVSAVILINGKLVQTKFDPEYAGPCFEYYIKRKN